MYTPARLRPSKRGCDAPDHVLRAAFQKILTAELGKHVPARSVERKSRLKLDAGLHGAWLQWSEDCEEKLTRTDPSMTKRGKCI